VKLGEYLISQQLITEEELQRALEEQRLKGGKLGDILLATTSMRAQDYYRSLSAHFKLIFVQLLKYPIDDNLLTETEKDFYLAHEAIPVSYANKSYTVATSDLTEENFASIKEHWGKNTVILGTSKYDVLEVLQRHYKHAYLTTSIDQLASANYHLSSKRTISTWQRLFFFFGLIAIVTWAVQEPKQFLLALNCFFMVSIVGILLYKFILSLIAASIHSHVQLPELVSAAVEELPIYTILVPLYNENEVTLRNLCINIEKLDYPKHKLDIKILLEQDDDVTIKVLKNFQLPRYINFVYVPASEPRTKAKACNYGLQFARGKYLTLYDAEDRPDPLQLKIVLNEFAKGNDKLACVQCRLNFYNANDNWLTTVFAIEYIYWFDLLLPGLEYLGTPIPLGGTSNHFRTDFLRVVNAWDPFNVAEDADLGVRLTRLGYHSTVAPSTTYEEATCHGYSWIKQRTRWIKGYMQTYLVHMHTPLQLLRSLGARGFIGFHLFIGGTILTNLANILLWIVFIMSFFGDLSFLFPGNTILYARINFFIGAALMILLNMFAVMKKDPKNIRFILCALTSPLYWLMMSVASYRALYQLLFNPSHWEKTTHGVSKTLN
jgi:cellulose synthase/poly-beta-1,6-N-acetylglucosamine synthase-like glycosyltransferase